MKRFQLSVLCVLPMILLSFSTDAWCQSKPGSFPLKWPSDVGTSHFGTLGNKLERLSGAWIRPHPGPFVWGWSEISSGRYNWSGTDRWVRKWQRRRLAVLVTIWPFAEWDQELCNSSLAKARNLPKFLSRKPGVGERLYSPCNPRTYASWLSAAVERYDGDGIDDMPGLLYPIRHWEVGNEPDMQGPNFTLFQGNSESYLHLLKLSYKTIKSADSSAVILPAAPGTMRGALEYFKPMFEGGTNYFDVGNMHSLQGDDDFFASEYHGLLENAGAKDKPFWITEAGIFMRGKPLEQETLAKLLIPNYASAFANGAHVIFKLQRGHSSGQVLGTYLLMAQTFGKFTAVNKIADNAVQFQIPDGQTVFALWEDAKLPRGVNGKVKVIDYTGEESITEASRVLARVPILVIVK